jgi:hypothetical protein
VKLAVVFEVPDGTDYAEVVGRMIAHHAFAGEQEIKHWSFDLEMRPTAALQFDADLAQAVTTVAPEMPSDLVLAVTALVQDMDRNARGYGWEVGRGQPLREVMTASPDNPFMDPDWQAPVAAAGDGQT